jgi:hypothetical protein
MLQDEDEVEWLAKERRRLSKDVARMQPVLLAGSGACVRVALC